MFKQAWNGTASLAKAFWLIYFLFGIIISIIVSIIALKLSNNQANVYNLTIAIVLPYTLFSAICVWRCAKNAWILWNILARLIAILAVIGGVVGLLRVLQIMQ